MAVETEKNWYAPSVVEKIKTYIVKFYKSLQQSLRVFGFHRFFISLWRRIVVINLVGLVIFIGGIFYLNEFRKSLIEANVRSLEAHGEIIAVAIAATATPSPRQDTLVDLENLFAQIPDEITKTIPQTPSTAFQDEDLSNLEFPINPERIGPIIRYLLQPTNTRARIYRTDGDLILDSDDFYSQGQIIRQDPTDIAAPRKGVILEMFQYVWDLIYRDNLPTYVDIGKANGKAYPEVVTALTGTSARILRVNNNDETIVSVAVPIKKLSNIQGVLLLSTRAGEIDDAVSGARLEIFRVAFVAIFVSVLLSLYLAGTIAGPMRRLAAGAERVRKSIKAREEIPDFTHRKDEIGHLSQTLREMTSALYRRIDAIESFAADVSHELKNPMTSLKSAAETLEIVKTDEDRAHLVEIIRNDVGRLNRLITDISDASRLDAELVKADTAPVDITSLIETVVNIFNDIHRSDVPQITVNIAEKQLGSETYIVNGHAGRLGQVLNNLLDNAISFVDENERVWVKARRFDNKIEICVEDEGPGIPPDNLEKIFDRFYTDRPGENAFGENSGLGLNISRQIIAAHGGKIWAENRYVNNSIPSGEPKKDAKPIGARMIICLPVAVHDKNATPKRSKHARI